MKKAILFISIALYFVACKKETCYTVLEIQDSTSAAKPHYMLKLKYKDGVIRDVYYPANVYNDRPLLKDQTYCDK